MRSPFSYMEGSRRPQPAADAPAAEPPKSRRSIREALTDVLGKDAFDKASSPSTQMSLALGQKQVYAGTVAQATIDRRRAANKQAGTGRAPRTPTGGPLMITDNPNDPGLREHEDTGMQKAYLVLSDEERAKGFVRPVRRSYRHMTCGTVTTMGQAIAETYARDPKFYGATFCAGCGSHFPVGEDGEFVWEALIVPYDHRKVGS